MGPPKDGQSYGSSSPLLGRDLSVRAQRDKRRRYPRDRLPCSFGRYLVRLASTPGGRAAVVLALLALAGEVPLGVLPGPTGIWIAYVLF